MQNDCIEQNHNELINSVLKVCIKGIPNDYTFFVVLKKLDRKVDEIIFNNFIESNVIVINQVNNVIQLINNSKLIIVFRKTVLICDKNAKMQ